MVQILGNSKELAQTVFAGAQGEFTLTADEPVSTGGENRGPTPYELILSALGSCMSMTMILYSRRKGWPLENVAIKLSHNRIHATDCVTCETKAGMLDEIRSQIKLVGNLTAEQREKIFSMAQKCPVHTTLAKEVVIHDVLQS